MAILNQQQSRPSAAGLLAMPRAALSPQQQLEALRRVQAQAEQRVQLGKRLFLAAESQTTRYQRLVEQLDADRQTLRQQIKHEMQATLLNVNEKYEAAEDRVAQAIDRLEKRVEQLESQWTSAAERLQASLDEAKTTLDAVRQSMNQATPEVAPAVQTLPPAEQHHRPTPAAGPVLSYRELMSRMFQQQQREAR